MNVYFRHTIENMIFNQSARIFFLGLFSKNILKKRVEKKEDQRTVFQKLFLLKKVIYGHVVLNVMLIIFPLVWLYAFHLHTNDSYRAVDILMCST